MQKHIGINGLSCIIISNFQTRMGMILAFVRDEKETILGSAEVMSLHKIVLPSQI